MNEVENKIKSDGQSNGNYGPVSTTFLGIAGLLLNFLVSNMLVFLILAWSLFNNENFHYSGFADFRASMQELLLPLMKSGWVVSLTVIVGATFAIAYIWMLGIFKNVRNILVFLDFKKLTRKDLLLWFFIYSVFIVISEVVGRYMDRPEVPEFILKLICNPGSYVLLFIAVAFLAPVFEEFLFRGFWFKGYINSKWGLLSALLIPNLVWAGIHMQYDLYDIIQVFLIGLILGLSRFYTSSLAMPVLLHIFQNTIAFIMSYIIVKC